jgi:hypothetical protein
MRRYLPVMAAMVLLGALALLVPAVIRWIGGGPWLI